VDAVQKCQGALSSAQVSQEAATEVSGHINQSLTMIEKVSNDSSLEQKSHAVYGTQPCESWNCILSKRSIMSDEFAVKPVEPENHASAEHRTTEALLVEDHAALRRQKKVYVVLFDGTRRRTTSTGAISQEEVHQRSSHDMDAKHVESERLSVIGGF
jgi:hypothetical protein